MIVRFMVQKPGASQTLSAFALVTWEIVCTTLGLIGLIICNNQPSLTAPNAADTIRSETADYCPLSCGTSTTSAQVSRENPKFSRSSVQL